MPNLSVQEIRNVILNIKAQLEGELGETVSIEDSPGGRKGSRLFVNIKKKGIKSLEVIGYRNGTLNMGIAVSNKQGEESETSTLVKSIMHLGGYKLIKDQTNPRYEYSLDTFIEAYDFLSNHTELEDIESQRLSRKLFGYKYDALKIAKRYAFAIEEEDQQMLDLCRQLLDADRFDSSIKLNERSPERSYREHVVPCVLLHNRVIELFLDKQDPTQIARFIKKNLKIAYISVAEAHRLDYELGLRTTMPNGWSWGDDILARLKVASIVL